MKRELSWYENPLPAAGKFGVGLGIVAFLAGLPPALAATPAAAVPQSTSVQERTLSAEAGAPLQAVIGKSSLIRLPEPVARMSIANPTVADVTLISPREIYLLGKTLGSTNLVLWTKAGNVSIFDITVSGDAVALQEKLRQLLPGESGIVVTSAAESVVLSGRVSDAAKVDQAVTIAEAYVRSINRALVLPVTAGDSRVDAGARVAVGGAGGGGAAAGSARVVNLLQVTDPQQVVLEVKVAEVSRTLLDQIGAELNMSRTNGSWTYLFLSEFLSGGSGLLGAAKAGLTKTIAIDAERRNGLVKVLAEPNIMAISGQKGSFLAGGKIFIPVARDNTAGGTTISLEEKEFGIGLSFTPTVIDAGRINLVVTPEVSELSQTGSPFTTVNGVTSVLPSFTVRRAATTVQLADGQSFAIAGLIKNNVTETVRAFPVLGELPIIGALFRSSEFQSDKTELVFIVTPRLVKPLPANYALPTDGFVEPSRAGFFLGGRMEGSAKDADKEEGKSTSKGDEKATAAPQTPAAGATAGGFEVK